MRDEVYIVYKHLAYPFMPIARVNNGILHTSIEILDISWKFEQKYWKPGK